MADLALSAATRPATVAQDIVRATVGYIPTESLIQHEWASHGTCSGLSAADYFASVRRARDELHFIQMDWDPVLASWKDLKMVRSQEIDKALSTTYKFLASRFQTGKSIMRKKSPQPPAAAGR